MNLSSEDESSDSSSNECLVTPGELNLNNSFFKVSTSKPSSSKIKDDTSSDSDDDFLGDNNDKVDSVALLAEVMKNLENANKPKQIQTTSSTAPQLHSPDNEKKKILSDEITNLLLQGETGLSSTSLEADDDDVETSEDVKPPTEYKIPTEGVNIILPGSAMMTFNGRKKRANDLEETLRKKMNQRLRSNQIFIHKVGLLCWLAYGFHLNREINDCEVLSTSLSLVPSTSYPKGRVDLKYLEQFTKWFKNLFKFEFKDVNEAVGKETLLIRLKEKKIRNHRELVLLYAATLRAIGLNCRIVISLCPPALKLQRDQLFQTKQESNDKKTSICIPKKELKESKNKSKKKMRKIDEETGGKIVPENSSQLEQQSKLDARKRAAEVLSKFSRTPAKKSIKLIIDKKDEKNKFLSSPEKNENKSLENNKMETKSPLKNKNDTKNPEIMRGTESPPKRQLRSRGIPQTSQLSPVINTAKKVTFVEEKEKKKLPEKRCRSTRASKTTVASTSTKIDSSSDEELKFLSPRKKKKTSEDIDIIKATSSESENDFEIKSATKKKVYSKKMENEAKNVEIDQDFETISLKNKKIQTKQEIKKLTMKNKIDASKKSEKRVKSDSDDDFQPKPIIINKKIETLKKESRAGRSLNNSIDRRVLSSDDEFIETVDAKGAQNIWVEVYVESEESWISVSVPDDKIHCVSDIYKKAPKPVLYVIAWNSVGSVKDVTRRYCPHWLTVTRKQRIDENWWSESLNPWKEKNTVISRAEDEMLLQRELEQPLPKTVGECKGHPLYALARHLLKFEAIYPPESVPLGHLKSGDAIFSRHCVHTLYSRETWIRKARVVKPAQEPYKIVKAMPKYDKLSGTVKKDLPLELFGKWQTDQYVPPVAKDGIVPRNEFGTVDLFKACMLPIGTVHINLPALNRVARKLNIDCVPAIVGFNFGARGAMPTSDGYVVCAEFEETLREAWHADQIESAKRAKEKREKRIYGNWKKLIKGLFIRERLAARYDFNEEADNDEDDGEKASSSKNTQLKHKLPEIKKTTVRRTKKS